MLSAKNDDEEIYDDWIWEGRWVGLRLRFISAACYKCEEMHVGLIVGVCEARSEFGCGRRYLSGQGGIWVLVRL